MEVAVHIEAEVNPTESQEKVEAAIGTIVEGAKISTKPSSKGVILIAEASDQESLFKLHNVLRSDRIRDAARKQLFRSIQGNTISFCLNKQVAFSGHISFCEESGESPLGSIKIQIVTDNPVEMVEWLAKKT
jgi:uncharacterized protein